MRPVFLPLLALLLTPASLDAGEKESWVSLEDAVVYASPGVPTGLHPHLPGGHAPKRLDAALPDGPVLVLGLPDSDPAARHLARAFDLLPLDEDLRGGYVAGAWHDGDRPIGVIFGGDAAALYAARDELIATSKAGVGMRTGVRRVRPRFRVRALLPQGDLDRAVERAIAGHANRFWIDSCEDLHRMSAEILPRLRRYGIEPVLHASTGSLDEWKRDAGIRHYAVVGDWPPIGRRNPYPGWGNGYHVILEIAEEIASWGQADVLVVHRTIEHTPSPPVPPALRGMPGLAYAWTGQDETQVRVTRGAAERARAEAGVKLHFLEGWCSVQDTPVPSRARGRASDLGAVVEGIVVVDGPGAGGVLADSWRPSVPELDAMADNLLPLLPPERLEPRAFLVQSADRIEAAARAPDAVAWLALLARRIRHDLGKLPEHTLLVPRVPAPITADGHLDEPAWAHAVVTRLPATEDPRGPSIEVLAVADGRRLALAIRVPAELDGFVLRVETLGGNRQWFLTARDFGPSAPWRVRRTRPGAHAWRATAEGGATWEGILDHYDLHGDAHPTRVFVIATDLGGEQKTAIVLGR